MSYHFSEEKPYVNIPNILDILNEKKIIDLPFSTKAWKNNTSEFIKTLDKSINTKEKEIDLSFKLIRHVEVDASDIVWYVEELYRHHEWEEGKEEEKWKEKKVIIIKNLRNIKLYLEYKNIVEYSLGTDWSRDDFKIKIPEGSKEVTEKIMQIATIIFDDIASNKSRWDNFYVQKARYHDIQPLTNEIYQQFIVTNNSIFEITMNVDKLISLLRKAMEPYEDDQRKLNFIEKFKIKQEEKMRKGRLYLIYSALLFASVIIGNICVSFFQVNSKISLMEFVQHFLWHNIYAFCAEVLILILAFSFFGLFKKYAKLSEMYDAHILLIESDFYYKDDIDLQWKGDKTFELRKENTQKIHNLPEKSFDILSGKGETKSDIPIIQAIEQLTNTSEKILHNLKK